MSEPEVTLDEIYAEVDKRIAALETKLTALIEQKFKELADKLPPAKESLRILRKRGA